MEWLVFFLIVSIVVIMMSLAVWVWNWYERRQNQRWVEGLKARLQGNLYRLDSAMVDLDLAQVEVDKDGTIQVVLQ